MAMLHFLAWLTHEQRGMFCFQMDVLSWASPEKRNDFYETAQEQWMTDSLGAISI